jgi:peptidoglycan glycosyltransferase
MGMIILIRKKGKQEKQENQVNLMKHAKINKYENLKNQNNQENDEERNIDTENVNEEPINTKDRINKDIMKITYIFVGLFAILLGYFTYFIFVDSEEVINNAYNKRQDLLTEQIVRGSILSSDNQVLAVTKVNEDGEEVREYPYGSMFAHVVGRFSKGRTGIESTENFTLLTSNTNGIKKIFNEITGKKSIGDNIVTTLDTKLQKTAYEALGDYKGAVIVMEPSSGKILAMVSKPDYDPNTINETWNDLINKEKESQNDDTKENESALLNRATQGLYPPGSTFKILTILEYIRENPDYEDYTYHCEGTGVFNSVTINCYNNKKHGEVNLLESFAKSCNTSFANISTSLSAESFRKLCDTFLFNNPLPTDFVYNRSSFVIDKKSENYELPQTSIGQGDTQITPLHNGLIVATIANGGAMMKPYVVDHVENESGIVTKKYMPEIFDTLMTPEEADILTSYMAEVVNSGTATALSGKEYSVAGKTGSAEYQENMPAHAWFVGFSNIEKPDIVVSIIVESVGTGSDYAVPIAAKIFDAYYDE